MKKYILLFLIICSTSLVFTSCSKDDHDDVTPDKDASDPGVKEFVYEGLNIYYLYKDQNEVLADDYFSDKKERNEYLNTFDTPEDLFQSLIYEKDRFSIIIPNYHDLLKALNGISLNNGMNFVLYKFESNKVFGVVRYVLPNTSAKEEGVERGMIFNRIDGQKLTTGNYNDLLNPDNYTIGLADLEGAEGAMALVSKDKEITLNKEADYAEDPVFLHKTIAENGHKIGYLLYNAFTSDYDEELNEVFGTFKGEGVTDLVVDLRYNGGGSVETSKDLASMITGQFKDEIFAKEIYNENFDDDNIYFDDEIHTGAKINNLNLNKVYILTSDNTASASELLINNLRPYINVVQVGDRTVGKFQASITLYDSDDFIHPPTETGHDYAMQPLVIKTANADGDTEYFDGLKPNIDYIENPQNMGVLGDPDEPLLKMALDDITSSTRAITTFSVRKQSERFEQVGESQENQLNYRRMHIDKKE